MRGKSGYSHQAQVQLPQLYRSAPRNYTVDFLLVIDTSVVFDTLEIISSRFASVFFFSSCKFSGMYISMTRQEYPELPRANLQSPALILESRISCLVSEYIK